jgi:hypothetical protein
MNNTIRHFMRKRNRIHHKAVRSKNPLHWENIDFLAIKSLMKLDYPETTTIKKNLQNK